jgi:hypothetical protein
VTTVTQKPPAIAGVSTGPALIMVVYPSIAAAAMGKLLGRVYDSIPLRVGGIKLSHLLFCLPTAPLAVFGYFLLKLTGEVYALTTRSVQLRNSLGNRLIREVPLSSIDQVVIRQEPGQEFYPAADIYLLNKAGETIMTLPGVPRADVFRQTILEARSAQDQVAAALTTIGARHATA